jgi:secondary thiamine-phosphate synthase enzyme
MSTHHHVKLSAYPKGCHLVTEAVLSGIALPSCGIVHVFIQHTSAALAINENASPDVRHDLQAALDRLAPENPTLYRHTEEGPDDMPAHVKSVLCGASVSFPVQDGKPLLGQWQGIYLLEFRDQAPPRKLVVTVLP